jgi:hypothetical protein
LHFWKQERKKERKTKQNKINSEKWNSKQRERNDASEASIREMGEAILGFGKETQNSIAKPAQEK